MEMPAARNAPGARQTAWVSLLYSHTRAFTPVKNREGARYEFNHCGSALLKMHRITHVECSTAVNTRGVCTSFVSCVIQHLPLQCCHHSTRYICCASPSSDFTQSYEGLQKTAAAAAAAAVAARCSWHDIFSTHDSIADVLSHNRNTLQVSQEVSPTPIMFRFRQPCQTCGTCSAFGA